MNNELTYTHCGDYFIPDIQLSHASKKPLGKYGRMRRAFLKENDPMLLNDLILTEELFSHLWEVQHNCEKRLELLMSDLLAKNSAPDKKAQQFAWTQHMNMLKAQAEEIVVAELIYS